MAKKIFISYRRQDAPGYTQALQTSLIARIARQNIFMDVTAGFPPGSDYAAIIEKAVIDCDTFLAVMGPEWEEIAAARDPQSRDWIEYETCLALQLKKEVIPVLINRVDPPSRTTLPETMHRLLDRQAVRLRAESFEADTAKLVDFLTQEDEVPTTAPQAPWTKKAGKALGTAVAVGIAVLIALSEWGILDLSKTATPSQCLAALDPSIATQEDIIACERLDSPDS